jgi:uncharacterized protein YdhG (YjbR/CyaY superfamily)
MRSDAKSVEDYLAGLDPERRERLEPVRDLCLRHLPQHEEAIEFGMPVYRRHGKAEFAFASQARHIALYVIKPGVAEANAELLASQDMGKSCLRFKPTQPLDEALVRALLESTARL